MSETLPPEKKKKPVKAASRTALAPKEVPGIAASERIPDVLRAEMSALISRYGGSEVLFVCTLKDGMVDSIHDAAHGNQGMVPVPKKQIECGMVIIHNHPSGLILPSDADLRVASQLAEEGVGSWIVDNSVEHLYPIIEALGEGVHEDLDLEQVSGVLDAGGQLSRHFPTYSVRQGQIDMLRTVARAFNESAIAAIEAGTGIGKSFAYLIPAAQWALKNKERVVISTGTINLQQQLMEKDIPLLRRILGMDIKAVLAKGRGNYLCVKRLGEALEEDSLLREEDSELSRLQEWAKVSQDGSKSDLGFIPADVLWSRINADADACPGQVCPKRDACFFFKARREASSAHLVVANHHLVFADAAARGQGLGYEASVVLPAFQRIIFDEAHNMEDSAVDFFALTLNRWMLAKYLNLFIRRRKGRVFGALPLVLQSLGMERIQEKNLTVEDFEDLVLDVRESMRLADEAALVLMGQEFHVRLVPGMDETLAPLMTALGQLQIRLHDLVRAMETILEELDDQEPAKEIAGLVDLRILVRRVSSLAAACDTFRNYTQETDRVLWIQRERMDKGDAFAHFTACPLDIAPRLRESIFEPYPTVVMCSATLTVGGEFSWWARRLGLFAQEDLGGGKGRSSAAALARREPVRDEWSGYDSSWGAWDSMEASPRSAKPVASGGEPILEDKPADLVGPREPEELHLSSLDRKFFRIRLDSPFDYRNRVLLAVPSDAPEPQSPGFQIYLNTLVAKLLLGSGGHALVLFTSYEMLSRTWDHVKPLLDEAGIPAFRQGDMERSKLLKTFNTQITSCLFATESFWEGVDSPGDALQVLILSKLPFKVPTEPLQLARSEAIQARGGNPFMELSVPEAVMKFRQGFGRLMRRNEDYGVVVIPDKRLFTKAYGKTFTKSLPETRTCQAPTEQLLEESLEFLGRMRRESTFQA